MGERATRAGDGDGGAGWIAGGEVGQGRHRHTVAPEDRQVSRNAGNSLDQAGLRRKAPESKQVAAASAPLVSR